MPRIYKKNCKVCNKYTESPAKFYCSLACSSSNVEKNKKKSESLKGKPTWNKGKKGWKSNNSLVEWRSEGGRSWNLNTKGLTTGNSGSFKKGQFLKELNPNWKGGITDKNRLERQSKIYASWRDEVYKRDRFTCQECFTKCQKKDIVAHHIKSFADFPELRYEVSNGVVLCRSCHAKVHNPDNKFNKTANKSYAVASQNFS